MITPGRVKKLPLLSLAAILVATALAQGASLGLGLALVQARDVPSPAAPHRAQLADGPGCNFTGKTEITIVCDYDETPVPDKAGDSEPRIALNHAALTFKTREENYMRIELTFTNLGEVPVLGARSVYLGIDDDAGHNYVRRALLHVDFRRLVPGQRLAFTDRLLIAAFQPGRYTIHLWIPNPDPSLAFNPSHNYLLSNPGVGNKGTGLNTVATFKIVR
jgi:hypothetical protein